MFPKETRFDGELLKFSQFKELLQGDIGDTRLFFGIIYELIFPCYFYLGKVRTFLKNISELDFVFLGVEGLRNTWFNET